MTLSRRMFILMEISTNWYTFWRVWPLSCHTPMMSFERDSIRQQVQPALYTLKISTPIEDGDPILKLLPGVCLPEIQSQSFSGSCLSLRITSQNFISGWETPRKCFKMESPSSTSILVLRVYNCFLNGTRIFKHDCLSGVPSLNKKKGHNGESIFPASCPILIGMHIEPHNWHPSIVGSCVRSGNQNAIYTAALSVCCITFQSSKLLNTLYNAHSKV